MNLSHIPYLPYNSHSFERCGSESMDSFALCNIAFHGRPVLHKVRGPPQERYPCFISITPVAGSMVDIPPRLSDRQKFVLGWMVRNRADRDERLQQRLDDARDDGNTMRYRYARRRWLRDYGTVFTPSAPSLSRAVAREFGEMEDIERKTEAEILDEQAEQLANAETSEEKQRLYEKFNERNEFRRALNSRPIRGRVYDERMTDEHRSTHSRTLRRLDERGLLDRERSSRGHTTAVMLTDEGREVGGEILRQHADGRYSLAFDTLD